MPKRKLTGEVTSTKGEKTAVVTVTTRKTHPIYKKQYTTSKKYYVHDEKNEAGVGDRVSFIESTPISKLKRWKLEGIVEKNQTPGEAA